MLPAILADEILSHYVHQQLTYRKRHGLSFGGQNSVPQCMIADDTFNLLNED